MASTPLQRTWTVARKEVLHLLRDPQTLLMTLFFPILELVMLGYAIDTNVRRIPTVVLDHARTQESAALIRRYEATGDFRFVAHVRDEQELTRWIREGRARVGIKIPENYSRQQAAGREAQLLVLVDGTVSAVAAQALGTSNALALRDSLEVALKDRPLQVEARPRVLFNPDMKSASFFVPGLMVVLCQMMAVTLSANSIVREKEKGTLEQLFLTPIRPAELILGKLAPYLVLTFAEFIGIALLARVVFGVPMNGPFWVLLAIALPFVLTMLAWGLWVSTQVETRDAAMQSAMASMMPCIFLSGYVFPLDTMPTPFWIIAQLIPTTWLVDASRGVILRGAGFAELWPHAAVLTGMAVGVLAYTAAIFKKRL
ncbi:MAG: ABC transporter permease [Gemmataceae bacterium]|nr:ABC transporter permease [Gemmataceae bacterium]